MRPTPDWLVEEPYEDSDLGVLKTGKEAQINVIQRTSPDGASCLIALKRYLPREVNEKGALERLGVQGASTFRNDVEYREGRQFRKSRDRRAVATMSTHGKRLMQDRWTGHEHDVMERLWQAEVSVPYPIAFAEDVLELEYIGDANQAAPQLQAARLSTRELADAYDQLVVGLREITAQGIGHGDLSAYNLLWWEGQLWFIDFPQSVDIAANPQGLNYVHRDAVNICKWFKQKGMEVDGEELFADLLSFI